MSTGVRCLGQLSKDICDNVNRKEMGQAWGGLEG